MRFLDNGDVRLESQLQPGIDETISERDTNKNFIFDYDPTAQHFEPTELNAFQSRWYWVWDAMWPYSIRRGKLSD